MKKTEEENGKKTHRKRVENGQETDRNQTGLVRGELGRYFLEKSQRHYYSKKRIKKRVENVKKTLGQGKWPRDHPNKSAQRSP